MSLRSLLASLVLTCAGAFASAAPVIETVALPLDGMLLQRIPERNSKLFPAGSTFSYDVGGSKFHYFIRPGAGALIAKLKADGFKIAIQSWEDDAALQAVAQNFKIAEMRGASLADVADVILKRDQSLDKAGHYSHIYWGGDLSKTLFVRIDGYPATPELMAVSYNSGPLYYSFPSFKAARDNANGGNPKFFPATEDEWTREWNKLIIFYADFALNYENRDAAQLQAAFNTFRSHAIADRIRAGTELLAGRPLPKGYEWKTQNAGGVIRAVGCAEYQLFPRQLVRDATFADCESTIAAKFEIADAGGRAECRKLSAKDGIVIRTEPRLDPCLAAGQTGKLQFLLTNPSAPSCGVYSDKMQLLQNIDAKYCKGTFVVVDPADGRGYTYTPFAGFEKLNDAELLSRAKVPPPTPAEFNRLFDPAGDLANDGLDVRGTCTDPANNHSMKN